MSKMLSSIDQGSDDAMDDDDDDGDDDDNADCAVVPLSGGHAGGV